MTTEAPNTLHNLLHDEARKFDNNQARNQFISNIANAIDVTHRDWLKKQPADALLRDSNIPAMQMAETVFDVLRASLTVVHGVLAIKQS